MRRESLLPAWIAIATAIVMGSPVAGQGSSARVARGYPAVAVHPESEHGGGGETFAATEGPDGALYFGTLQGITSFDGAWWDHLAVPNDSAVFTVASGRQSVGVGAFREMGWVSRDSTGSLAYHSLIDQIPAAFRDTGDVRGVCRLGDGFLYVSQSAAIAWTGGQVRVAADLRNLGDRRPTHCDLDGGGNLYLSGGQGAFIIDPDSGALRDAGIGSRRVDLVLALSGRRTLLHSAEGFAVVDFAGVHPYAPAASDWFRTRTVAAGARLADGRVAIAAANGALLLLSDDGAIDQTFDGAGLPPTTIRTVTADRDGALWIGCDGPIVRLDLSSPVTMVDDRSGLRGSVVRLARFSGRTYVAHSQGVSILEPTSAGLLAAHPLAGIDGAAWSFAVAGEDLLIATSRGIYCVRKGGSPTLVTGSVHQTCFVLLASATDPNLVWAAMRQGIAKIERTGDGWKLGALLPGTPPYARTLLERPDGLWAGTIFNGVAHRSNDGQVTFHGSGELSVYVIDGVLAAADRQHGLRVIGGDGRLRADARFRRVGAGFFHLAQDRNGTLWINSIPAARVPRLPDGSFAARQPIPEIDEEDIQSVAVADDGVVWFGGSHGAYRYDSRAPSTTPQPSRPLVRAIAGNEALGNGSVLPYASSRVRLRFSPLSYRPGVVYQYRLDPVDDEWSGWTATPFIDYTTLAPHSYAFHLRAKGPLGTVGPEATWAFTIATPWYRTPWAEALWVALAILAVAAIVRLRTAALRRDARRLGAIVDLRTAELREANSKLERLSLLDELTGIPNRRYFQRAVVEDWRIAVEIGKPLALILIDIDRFKDLNDRRGHAAGDAALVAVAQRLAGSARTTTRLDDPRGDVVARIGGEEFGVILANAGTDDGAAIAETLRQSIEDLLVEFDGEPLRVTVSCGVAATTPQTADGWDDLMERADRALYAAKAAGRNTVRRDGAAAEERATDTLKDSARS